MMHYPETKQTTTTAEMNTMVGVDILEQMTTHSTKKKLIKILSGEQNALEKQLQEFQDLADCIRSDPSIRSM